MPPSPSNPLTRSTYDRQLGGICGGVARWLGWDSTLIRALFLIGLVFTGFFPLGVIYAGLWLIMPRDDR